MKKALTIGELLITLAIIGIIAMLVLPDLMKDYHKKVYISKLKKSVETIENAVQQASADNDVSYFYQTQYVMHSGQLQNFINNYFRAVPGSADGKSFASSYSSLSGQANTLSLDGYSIAQLTSGESIAMKCSLSLCEIYVDVNSTVAPNIGGRDIFYMKLNPKTNRIYDDSTASGCNSSALGIGCVKKLLDDNWNMNY